MLAENIDRWKEAFINQGIEKGIEQGVQKGIEKGQLQGERQVLLKLITHRFSNVPTWALDKINAADADLLETWALRLFDVTTLEELLA